LNVGAGCIEYVIPGMTEISVDLFANPISDRPHPVCANVESLPFSNCSFDRVICLGEVLGYCDPQIAIKEMTRSLKPGGQIIFDYWSTRDIKKFITLSDRKAVDLFKDIYNGSEEVIWRYDGNYIREILDYNLIQIDQIHKIHNWSSVGKMLKMSDDVSLFLESALQLISSPWSALTLTIGTKT
jgi:SAM-dependent methyltransferase